MNKLPTLQGIAEKLQNMTTRYGRTEAKWDARIEDAGGLGKIFLPIAKVIDLAYTEKMYGKTEKAAS